MILLTDVHRNVIHSVSQVLKDRGGRMILLTDFK